MEEDNKSIAKQLYYTPSIEEFRVGFEYESNLRDEGWEKETFEFNEVDNSILNKAQYAKSILECYRVKYLDREDIEDFGFDLVTTNKMRYWYKYSGIPDKREGGYKVHSCRLTHDPKQNIIIIEMNIEAYDEKMFDGTIKNKSELKVLLKWLGIK